VSGSGISWAICKSRSRQIGLTTPAFHHSVSYRPDARPTKFLFLTNFRNMRVLCHIVKLCSYRVFKNVPVPEIIKVTAVLQTMR